MQAGMDHLWKEDDPTKSSIRQEEHVLSQTLNGTGHVKRVFAPVGGMQRVPHPPPMPPVSNHDVLIFSEQSIASYTKTISWQCRPRLVQWWRQTPRSRNPVDKESLSPLF